VPFFSLKLDFNSKGCCLACQKPHRLLCAGTALVANTTSNKTNPKRSWIVK
jgi:hypothetical protein